jgi:hypothetical protein
VTASSTGFLARAVPATLRLLAGRHGLGCLDRRDWQRFGAWMQARGLLSLRRRLRELLWDSNLPCKRRRSNPTGIGGRLQTS